MTSPSPQEQLRAKVENLLGRFAAEVSKADKESPLNLEWHTREIQALLTQVERSGRQMGAEEMAGMIQTFMAAGAVPSQKDITNELHDLLEWQKSEEGQKSKQDWEAAQLDTSKGDDNA